MFQCCLLPFCFFQNIQNKKTFALLKKQKKREIFQILLIYLLWTLQAKKFSEDNSKRIIRDIYEKDYLNEK